MLEITRTGKYSLIIETPVIIASGMMGFEPSGYRDLMKLGKLGAMVTSAVSWKARGPANGPRVVNIHGGFLLHTGLPNPGVNRVIKQYARSWERSPIPIIVHVIANRYEDISRAAEALAGAPGVQGIELGLHDQVDPRNIPLIIAATREHCQLPLLVKLPLYRAPLLAQAAQDGGADALVVAAPPRGTDRDPASGRLIGGRVYGPWLKPQALRAVGQITQFAQIPVIACGGIHSADDARDFLEVGARAVQIDTLTWIQPSMVEIIARNLGGMELTRQIGALADEWEPGLGETRWQEMQAGQVPPPGPPELPLGDDEMTTPSDPTE